MGDSAVYLDDRVLQYFESDSRYDAIPFKASDGRWTCSPGYGGQWDFTDWQRVGRNLIKVPLHALYKGVPDAETVRANGYALPQAVWSQRIGGEHIVAKVDRLVTVLLDLSDDLAQLSESTGAPIIPSEVFGLDRDDVRANGWGNDTMLRRLAHVCALDMDEQAFLARCKVLHERLQRLPNGVLKRILMAMGIPSTRAKQLGSLKLIQAVTNVAEVLNRNHETVKDSLPTANEPEDWDHLNGSLSALFVANDLRIADAHLSPGRTLTELERLGFDIAGVNAGYGLAFDFVLDRVIESLKYIEGQLQALLAR